MMKGISIRTGYFNELILSVFFALFAGFIMWYVGLWTAGDAKLFVAYTAIVPLSVYNYGYIKYFPSMTILINTFVHVFIPGSYDTPKDNIQAEGKCLEKEPET